MLITPEMVLRWKPCPEYPARRVRQLGGDGLEPHEVLNLDIPLVDCMWVVLHPEVIAQHYLRLFAARWAANVLPLFEYRFPANRRPREAIRAARLFALGRISHKELSAARKRALPMAWDRASASACEAARCDAELAAYNSAALAREAASFASPELAFASYSYHTERDRQIYDLESFFSGHLDLEAEAREALAEVTG